MKRIVNVKVTEYDIKNGVPAVPHGCPIAHAIRRAYPGHRIQVRDAGFYWDSNYLPLPMVALDFITDFDRRLSVTPIEFEFEVDDA